jgi:hypothetical protein
MGDEQRVEKAIDRALVLFSATIEQLIAEKSHRIKEVMRARDQYLALFYDGAFDEDADAIERYFMFFAFAARKSR